MKLTRKYRRLRRTARRTGIGAMTAALIGLLGGCGFAPTSGEIVETERGHNGLKVEYYQRDRDANLEVYLRPKADCKPGDLIQLCADPADLLVERGLRLGDSNVFQSCAEAEALNRAPLQDRKPGWNPALDQDRNGTACEG